MTVLLVLALTLGLAVGDKVLLSARTNLCSIEAQDALFHRNTNSLSAVCDNYAKSGLIRSQAVGKYYVATRAKAAMPYLNLLAETNESVLPYLWIGQLLWSNDRITEAMAKWKQVPASDVYFARLVWSLVQLLLIWQLLASNSRGPVLAWMLCLVTLSIVSYRMDWQRYMRAWSFVLFVSGLAAVVILPQQYVDRFPFSVMLTSAYERQQMLERDLAVVGDALVLGRGLSSAYPHNIFIEVLSAAGLIGVLALSVLLVTTLH